MKIVLWLAGVLGILYGCFLVFFIGGEIATDGLPPFWKLGLVTNIHFLNLIMIIAGLFIGWKWRGWGAILILAGVVSWNGLETLSCLINHYPLRPRHCFNMVFFVPLIVGLLFLVYRWKSTPTVRACESQNVLNSR